MGKRAELQPRRGTRYNLPAPTSDRPQHITRRVETHRQYHVNLMCVWANRDKADERYTRQSSIVYRPSPMSKSCPNHVRTLIVESKKACYPTCTVNSTIASAAHISGRITFGMDSSARQLLAPYLCSCVCRCDCLAECVPQFGHADRASPDAPPRSFTVKLHYVHHSGFIYCTHHDSLYICDIKGTN